MSTDFPEFTVPDVGRLPSKSDPVNYDDNIEWLIASFIPDLCTRLRQLCIAANEREWMTDPSNTVGAPGGVATLDANGHVVQSPASKGVANGLASLDGAALVPVAQLPAPLLVPAGVVCWFAMATPPVGWLKANGALVSRTTYAALFAAIGTTFGAGDGSTTLALPDLRGLFVRGFDDGRGTDAGRVFGSFQEHALGAHSHTYEMSGYNDHLTPQDGAYYWDDYNRTTLRRSTQWSGSTGGSETRPKNVALLACIKY